MSSERRFLTLDERAAYLVDRGYVDEHKLSDHARDFIARTNFHYFLGYARNFRKLRREGLVQGDDRIDRVIRMVEIDHDVSTRLFAAIRDVEWRLRAALVETHCALFPDRACFLEASHFQVMNTSSTPVHEILRNQISRSREPFVLGAFEKHAHDIGRTWTESPTCLTEDERMSAMRTLPIWSTVDGWTLGLLERVITETAPVENGNRWLWKDVARGFEVSNQVFQTQLTSLIVLRNLVAHHSRLWMRPTAASPRRPKPFEKLLRDSDSKSMYVAWLTLAQFLRAGGGDQALIDDLDTLIGSDDLYEIGVKRPLRSAALG